jgi:hypothetical protein
MQRAAGALAAEVDPEAIVLSSREKLRSSAD